MPAAFEKLRIWQEAHQLMLEIHELSRSLPKDERYRKRAQVECSSSSVPDNISEGKRHIDKEKADEHIERYERLILGINGYITIYAPRGLESNNFIRITE